MSNLWASETRVNATKGYQYGDESWSETNCETTGQLFRLCRSEFGRCTSKVYIDKKDGRTVQQGWVFVKLAEYEDTKEKYLQETWVSVSRHEPKRVPAAVYPISPWESCIKEET